MRSAGVALALSVAALAGCSFGSDSGGAEFIKDADAICAQHERQISLIPPPQTFLRDFAVFMQRAVPIAREQNEKLLAIQAPEDDELEELVRTGLVRAVDDAEQADALGGTTADLLRGLVRRIPVDLLLDLPGLLPALGSIVPS